MRSTECTFDGPILFGPAGLIAPERPHMRKRDVCPNSATCAAAVRPEQMCSPHALKHDHFVEHDEAPDPECGFCPRPSGLTGHHEDRITTLETDPHGWYDYGTTRPTDAAFATLRELLVGFGHGTVEELFFCPWGDGGLSIEHGIYGADDDVAFDINADGSVEIIWPVFDPPAGYDDNGLWFPDARAAHAYLYAGVRRRWCRE